MTAALVAVGVLLGTGLGWALHSRVMVQRLVGALDHVPVHAARETAIWRRDLPRDLDATDGIAATVLGWHCCYRVLVEGLGGPTVLEDADDAIAAWVCDREVDA